jgi:hypothetical protein
VGAKPGATPAKTAQATWLPDGTVRVADMTGADLYHSAAAGSPNFWAVVRHMSHISLRLKCHRVGARMRRCKLGVARRWRWWRGVPELA